MGSGTTALAARNLQRNSIGYEINPDYKKYYEEKVASSFSFGNVEYGYSNDISVFDIDEKMKTLPYIFSDPHKMESKIEIKKLQFGSRIDKDKKEREEYFSVKTILSPNTIVLNNGLTIRLLGIKEKPSVNGNATKFLVEKTKGVLHYYAYNHLRHSFESI